MTEQEYRAIFSCLQRRQGQNINIIRGRSGKNIINSEDIAAGTPPLHQEKIVRNEILERLSINIRHTVSVQFTILKQVTRKSVANSIYICIRCLLYIYIYR